MQFEVMNRRQVLEYVGQKHDAHTAIILISDNRRFAVVPKVPDVFYTFGNGVRGICPLWFDDVDYDSHDKYNLHCMQPHDADVVAIFVSHYMKQVDKFIVACEAGISRSAGVCAAIMLALNGSDKPIFDDPSKRPNMTCYRLTVNALGKRGFFEDTRVGNMEGLL